MSLIKKEVKVERKKVEVKLPAELVYRLDEYSQFLDSSRDHVVARALEYVMEKDREFVSHLEPKAAGKSAGEIVAKAGER